MRSGLRAMGAVMARWRWMIITVTVLAIVIGDVVAAVAPRGYRAEAVVLVTQSSVASGAQNGLNTAQELLNLMPTVETIAVSDQALSAIKNASGLSQSIPSLRSDVAVAVPPGTLTVDLIVTTSSAFETNALEQGLVQELGYQMASLGGSDPARSQAPVVMSLELSPAKRVPSEVLKITIIAFLIGLIFSGVGAFVFDRT
ncbi:MAG TPA: Wzz/FepE/Etk N-terminal domain-containing protein [Acidimicrobiales bacterium]|nr:Wzz/FepE/Etk N-terminal domain-containing protein [Acidimicrobiales bacterium]